jgi:hypothetical protein
MSDAWLREHPPARSQYRVGRRARPTGCTVVHTAEGVLDTVGPDTGAEATADFIRRRDTPGSYHDLVDSDSAIWLVRYGDEAYQDGTGSNPWALSISFALKTTDWARLTPERRDAFLRQGAIAFRRQQAWLRAHGHPTTPLRRISKAQSDAGQAGFISHGERDPDRRSDPGRDFPWTRFFEFCQEDDDMVDAAQEDRIARKAALAVFTTMLNDGKLDEHQLGPANFDVWVRHTRHVAGESARLGGEILARVAGLEAAVRALADSRPEASTDEIVKAVSAAVERGMADVEIVLRAATPDTTSGTRS